MDRSTTKHGPTQVATMINHFYNFYSNSQKDRQVNYSELSLYLWDLILLSLLGVAVAKTWLLCLIFLRVDYRYTTHFPAKRIWSVGSKPNNW